MGGDSLLVIDEALCIDNVYCTWVHVGGLVSSNFNVCLFLVSKQCCDATKSVCTHTCQRPALWRHNVDWNLFGDKHETSKSNETKVLV